MSSSIIIFHYTRNPYSVMYHKTRISCILSDNQDFTSMKEQLLSIAFCLFSICLISQNGPIDFEPAGEGASWTWTTFENGSNPELEIIANPAPDAVNSSATVASFTALQVGAPYAGCESMHGVDLGVYSLSSVNSTVKIMVWKSIISDVGIKLVTTSGGALPELKVANTLVGQWEEITFNFSGYIDNAIYAVEDVDQIVVFPDFSARTEDQIVFFDNITISEEITVPVPMVAAPDPVIDESNVISMFSNVYTDVPVTTWLTDWSAAGYSELQIGGNDTKLYSAVNFLGIETTGSDLIDASGMQYFHFDAWTPNMSVLKIKLVDFGADAAYEGGDDTEHELVFSDHPQEEWVSYSIPLSDFTGLLNTEHMAQFIYASEPIGSGVLYLDNIFFSMEPTGLNEESDNSFSLYPNPSQGEVRIQGVTQVESYKVFSMNGELIRHSAVSVNDGIIDLNGLSTGEYMVGLKVNGQWSFETLVVE